MVFICYREPGAERECTIIAQIKHHRSYNGGVLNQGKMGSYKPLKRKTALNSETSIIGEASIIRDIE